MNMFGVPKDTVNSESRNIVRHGCVNLPDCLKLSFLAHDVFESNIAV
jgi:hypothetical protein